MTRAPIEYLRDLVALTGPSGSEEDVVRALAEQVRPLVDRVELDAFGTLIATRESRNPEARRLVLAAHMDEIGFRVRKIETDGFLRLEKVGGLDNRILLAQRVWVRTGQARLLGVIGTRSAHLLREDDRKAVPELADLYVDVGARSADEARSMGVRLGDPVGFSGDLAELGAGSGRYTAHALDDRAGCAIVLAALDALQGQDLDTTVVALFTVQEEIGLRGAQAAIQGQHADLAIAIDTTAVDDTPDVATFHLRLGAGPAIKIMDFSMVAHPALRQGLATAAERAGCAVQPEILMGIGTDAGALQFGGHGTPVGTLSLGTRYTHSPIEVLDKADLDAAARVLQEMIRIVPELDLRFTALD